MALDIIDSRPEGVECSRAPSGGIYFQLDVNPGRCPGLATAGAFSAEVVETSALPIRTLRASLSIEGLNPTNGPVPEAIRN